MAFSYFKRSYQVFFFLILFSSHVTCTELEVGGEDGWIVPKSKKDGEIYNHWASQSRFKTGDTVNFKYKKDSVLLVTEEEYTKCKSSRPMFFSNNGDTDFKFDRPGLFYFISGVTGHCERGQKMVIKVLEAAPALPPQAANGTSNSTTSHAPAPLAVTKTHFMFLLPISLILHVGGNYFYGM